MLKFTARHSAGKTSLCCIIPSDMHDVISLLSKQSNEKHAGHMTFALSLPRRPRSVGERSQNSRHWAHCQDIANQLGDSGHTYTKEDIDAALRRMSVREGLPTFLNIDGAEEPIHCSEMSVEEASMVERVKQRFADEHNLWLTEYIDPENPKVGTYRSIGGQSYTEMRQKEEA